MESSPDLVRRLVIDSSVRACKQLLYYDFKYSAISNSQTLVDGPEFLNKINISELLSNDNSIMYFESC